MFILSIILLIIAIVALVMWVRTPKFKTVQTRDRYSNEVTSRDVPVGPIRLIELLVGAGFFILAVIFFLTSVAYTQDPGQAKVIRSWTGTVVGQTTTDGLHFKAPWTDVTEYNIRNQQVIFASTGDKTDENAEGPEITVQDKEGVSANIDITVRYSIDPSSVSEIYKKYGTQENFIDRFVSNDIRAGVRKIPAGYGTLQLLNSRAAAETQILDYLKARWEGDGVRAESVSLQEIRYPKEIEDRFNAAQASRIKVTQAEADLAAVKVEAQQKVAQATADAESNRILDKSLTPNILKQRTIDMLSKAQTIVVPEDFTALGTIGSIGK